MSEQHNTGDERIRFETDGHIGTIKVSRPEKLNALDFDMVLALERAALLADSMASIRSFDSHG